MTGLSLALAAGVNNFARINSPLRGCVNDAKTMRGIFRARGFEVSFLADKQMTIAAMRDWMVKVAAEAQAGSVSRVALSISSHGTQVPDASGDEPDRWDEAVVMYDTAPVNGKWVNVLTDDEIGRWLASIPQAVEVELFFDCCHAGTMSRAPVGFTSRYLPPPAGMPPATARRPAVLTRGIEGAGEKTRFLWEGCRADQTAADAVIGLRPCGAFTWAYAIAQKGITSRADILAKTRVLLSGRGYDQDPQLEIL